MPNDEVAQVFLILQCRALQKLAQLPHLNAVIHLVKPLPDALHHLGFLRVGWVLQLSARLHSEFVGCVELGIDAVKAPRNTPKIGSLLNVQGG
jgi:hypothetical protein